MKTYETYIDSGIEWLGDIPEGWNVVKLKYLAKHSTEKGQGDSKLKIALENIEGHTGRLLVSGKDEFEGDLKIFKKGNILFNKLRPYLAKVLLAEVDGECVSELLVFEAVEEKVSKHFLYKFLSSPLVISVVNSSTYGAKMPRASVDFILNLRLCLPNDKFEQAQIANYLDHQTGLIDQIIEKKQQLIEKLEEQRQAIINEAVTKGLNPSAKMKDSGVDWLGEIPEEWKVSYLKRFSSKITDGAHHSPKSQDSGKNYVSVKDVDEFGNIDLTRCKKISTKDFEDLVKNGCQPHANDILLTKDGTIGRAAIVDENDFVILSSLGLIRPNFDILNSNYLRYFLISGLNITQMYSMIAGAALTRLTIDKIRHLQITIPTLEEQQNIANYLDKKIRLMDKIIEKNTSIIEKLKEQRQSIISEAVTGKVDVRDWKPTKATVNG